MCRKVDEVSEGTKVAVGNSNFWFVFDQARSDYTALVDTVYAEQERLTLNQLPQALDLMKETADQMVSVVHTAINTFENLLSLLVGNSKQVCHTLALFTHLCFLAFADS